MPENAYALGQTVARTPLHRLPVRVVDPPYEDENAAQRHSGSAATSAMQGTLALAFRLPTGVPAIPSTPPAIGAALASPTIGGSGEPDEHIGSVRLTLVPSTPEPAAPSETVKRARRRNAREISLDDFGPQRTPRAALPAPKPWAGRLVQAIVEVIGGARPVAQLVRWTSTDVYDSVRRRSRYLAAAGDGTRREGSIVRSVHVVEPGDGVAEVCAVVQHGSRCRAIALRLEGVDGRWQCTALQLG